MYLLKDGRTVSSDIMLDFDSTHTNTVSRLTSDEYLEFVSQKLPDPLPPPPAPVTAVTPRQARLALLKAGLLDQVEAAVTNAGSATKITWDYASMIDRNDPLIASIATTLNLTSAQIDTLFQTASTL